MKFYSLIGGLLIFSAWTLTLGSGLINIDSNIIRGHEKFFLMTFTLIFNIVGVYFCTKTVDWKTLKLTSAIPKSLMFIAAGAFGIILSGIGLFQLLGK